jgi:hypothetical protein
MSLMDLFKPIIDDEDQVDVVYQGDEQDALDAVDILFAKLLAFDEAIRDVAQRRDIADGLRKIAAKFER